MPVWKGKSWNLHLSKTILNLYFASVHNAFLGYVSLNCYSLKQALFK